MNNLTADKPLKLKPARAWRTYLGGYMLDVLQGVSDPKDGNFPEEWIASVVAARSAGREQVKDEGLSRIKGASATLKELIGSDPAGFLGEEHFQKFGDTTGVLVKLIDSAERLTIQAHPDRETAKRLFSSDFGKTECWHILSGRIVGGQIPVIYLGFKPGVAREKWIGLFERQDIEGMLDCLHKFSVSPGDTFLIEGGVPHAIGEGCFLLEIQEPTDYTVRVEKVTPAGLRIDDFLCHQGLGFEKMFDCFHYDGLTAEETYDKWHIKPRLLTDAPGCVENEIIGYGDTAFFRATVAEISGAADVPCGRTFFGLFGLSGSGAVVTDGYKESIKKGDQFFIPAGVKGLKIIAEGTEPLKVFKFYGPKL